MNTKIRNYVDVLFEDIPNTRKAAEMKEEILSMLNEHFEEHIREGMSENQAYTQALSDMGDIDHLLEGLTPDKDIAERMNAYNKWYARNISISVCMYILSIACVAGFPALSWIFGIGHAGKAAILGLIVMLVLVAFATGLIAYTNMCRPTEFEPYLKKKNRPSDTYNIDPNSPKAIRINSFFRLYWLIVTIIYLSISFATFSWGISWIIWLIAFAVKEAICLIFGVQDNEK